MYIFVFFYTYNIVVLVYNYEIVYKYYHILYYMCNEKDSVLVFAYGMQDLKGLDISVIMWSKLHILKRNTNWWTELLTSVSRS